MSNFEMKWENVAPGDRASVYQAIESFQPYILPETNVAVYVRDVEEGGKEVEFILETQGAILHGKGQGESLYEATQTAGQHMLDQLRAAHDAIMALVDRDSGEILEIVHLH